MELLNKTAPNFSLLDKDNVIHSLKDFKEKFIVIFFYPKDNTPGCTIESQKFSESLIIFKKLDVAVIGVSGGDSKSKSKFCDKHNLKTLMLSDTNYDVARKYNSYGEKSFMGKKFNGIFRQTFVIDSKRKIIKIFDKVKPADHTEEVISYIKSFSVN